MYKGKFRISNELYGLLTVDEEFVQEFSRVFNVLEIKDNLTTKTIIAESPLFEWPDRYWHVYCERIDLSKKEQRVKEYAYRFKAELIN